MPDPEDMGNLRASRTGEHVRLGKALKIQHRLKIERLFGKGKTETLAAFLKSLSARGFDVAGLPFRFLDDVFSQGATDVLEGFEPLADVTLGGQPRLLRAILRDTLRAEEAALTAIIRDADAHPMTRFEAAGWQVFLRSRSALPDTGQSVRDVFQFWDDPTPPDDIVRGRAAWAACGHASAWYSEAEATDYITRYFGADAARDFGALWHPALKSDVFRLYRLVQDGGIYADADSLPGPHLAEFAQMCGDHAWGTAMTYVPNCVTNNYFLAAPPQSQVFAGFLEHVLRNLADRPVEGIFWLSGPGALTAYLHTSRSPIKLLPRGVQKAHLFSQFDAPYKQTQRNWRVYEHSLGITNDDALGHVLAQIEAPGDR